MIKRIVCEGQDRLGKTTQINLLEKYFDDIKIKYKYYHFKGPEDKKTETQFKIFIDNLYEINNSLIGQISLCDRDIYGEYVYGKLYRKNNPNFIFTIEKVFKKLTNQSILFLFEDSIKNILNREDGKSDTINYYKKLYEKIRFRICFYKSKCKYKKIINIKNKNIDKVYEIILKYINIIFVKEFNK